MKDDFNMKRNWWKFLVLMLSWLPILLVMAIADILDFMGDMFKALSGDFPKCRWLGVTSAFLYRASMPFYNFVNYVANNFWPKD